MRNFHLLALIACLMGLVHSAVAQDQPVLLTPAALGVPWESALQGGGARRFDLALQTGQYLNFSLEHQGLSVALSLAGPDGQPLLALSSGTETRGMLETAVLTEASGSYQLIVQGRGDQSFAGSFKLRVQAWRAATEQDRRWLTAQRLWEEGARLAEVQTVASRQQALAKYREALPHWRALGEQRRELETWLAVVGLQRLLSEVPQALEAARTVLAQARAAGLREPELSALLHLGSLHVSLAEYAQARPLLEQAYVLSRELQNRMAEKSALAGLGSLAAATGHSREATDHFQQALLIVRAIGDRPGEALLLNNLGVRFSDLGEPHQALQHYEQSLALRRKLGRNDNEGVALLNLSSVNFRLGEYQRALDYAQQALTLLRAAGRRREEGWTLQRLGLTATALGENEQALTYLQQALTLNRAVKDRRSEADSLRLFGVVQHKRGNFAQALEYLQQALALHQEIGSRRESVGDLRQLGVVLLTQGEPRAALERFTQSLALSRELKLPRDEAYALVQIGRAQRQLGETAPAAAALRAALALSRKAQESLTAAEALRELALIALSQREFQTAQTQLETAIGLIESTRAGLRNIELRTSYQSDTQLYYELYLEALLSQAGTQPDEPLLAQALEAVEHARARSLVEMLQEARANLRQGVDAELLQQERELGQRLTAKGEQLALLGSNNVQRENAATLRAEIADLTAQRRAVEARIRELSPAYAALIQPQPLSLAELRQLTLDENTLLLEYALGSNRSYLFAVTPTTLKQYVLPRRAEIETAARRFYELLATRSQPPLFHSLPEKYAWLTRLDQQTQAAAAALSHLLLAPVAAELGRKRLLIVPDGALHYVPFEALPEVAMQGAVQGRSRQSGAPSAPLIAKHEILRVPSASTLAWQRRALAGRALAPKTLAVLADPVFDRSDNRVTQRLAVHAQAVQAASPVAASAIQRGPSQAGQTVDGALPRSLPRLPASRAEAEAILALVPVAERQAALDFNASQPTALSAELSQYRYVHFATHGVLNTEQPDLSGLVLSLVDESGRSRDGFISALQVFNLKLPAELVVLSGCQTALGKEFRGEGLVGLTRGFMYAGARRVLASLWQVNDRATAELMKRFYQHMLGAKRLTPAAALRQAQLELMKDPRWRAPYYWAAFTLQGEW
jgi:CHAT domain-containing protein/tetratricopeptide (TPR) repeat protein